MAYLLCVGITHALISQQSQDQGILFYKILENRIEFLEEVFGSFSGEAAGVQDLILKLTDSDQENRYSIADALQHPWLKDPDDQCDARYKRCSRVESMREDSLDTST